VSDYIRNRDPNDKTPPTRGYTIVTFPPDGMDPGGTYEVDTDLATEMNKLIQRGQVRAARTLFFWFDTTGVS
jgi:hypothetical protein